MSEINWIGLIPFLVVLLGTPGPAIISLLYSGINYGFKNSIPYFLGIVVGLFPNFLISAFSVGILLDFSTIYSILKYAMLAYILYLAYKIAISRPLNADDDTKPLHFSQGVLLSVLNPKGYATALSAISQFSIVDSYLYSTALIMVIYVAIAFVLQGSWCFAGQYLKSLFSHPKWYMPVNITLAVMLILSVVMAYI